VLLQQVAWILRLETWLETARSHTTVQRRDAKHTAAKGSKSLAFGKAISSVQGIASIDWEMVAESVSIVPPSKVLTL
jgi:hypothetical protein